MFNTFIENKGITKTIIHNNNQNSIEELGWDANYDGKNANIVIDSNANGIYKHYDITLDNEDLANIFNIESISEPIDKRLKKDFQSQKLFIHDPSIYKIEFENNKNPFLYQPEEKSSKIKYLLDDMTKYTNTHISSPLKNEEYIIPISIDKKPINKYTLTSKRRHRKPKTHKTFKAYKHSKSKSKKSKSRTSKSTPNYLIF